MWKGKNENGRSRASFTKKKKSFLRQNMIEKIFEKIKRQIYDELGARFVPRTNLPTVFVQYNIANRVHREG